jgi:hypothetical protein
MLSAGERLMPQIRFFLTALTLLLCLQARDQRPSDFAGEWEMDPSRSESAHQAVPIGPITLSIKQNADDLSIETRTGDKDHPPVSSETLTFKLNGPETTISGNAGLPVKVKAQWDGTKLTTETARNIRDSTVTTMDVYTLDSKRRDLTVQRTLTIQHGYQFSGAANSGKGKDVFIKRKGPK